MTKLEATSVLAPLQKALSALGQNEAREAVKVLMTDSRVFTTAHDDAADFGRAVETLKKHFRAMDQKGIRFSPD